MRVVSPKKRSGIRAEQEAISVRAWRRLSKDELGSVLVEASVIMPTLILLTFGLVTLGFIGNIYVTLNSATSAAARLFALDAPASTTSLSATPYSDLKSQLNSSSGLLSTLNTNASLNSTGGITLTSVCIYPAGSSCSGNTCNSDASCNTLLANGQNDIVMVQTSYPCFLAFQMFGLNNCTLSAAATFAIQ